MDELWEDRYGHGDMDTWGHAGVHEWVRQTYNGMDAKEVVETEMLIGGCSDQRMNS